MVFGLTQRSRVNMFYPHTIKGKPFPRLDLIGTSPPTIPPTGPPMGGLQGWIQGDAGLTKDLSVNDYTVTNTNVTIGAQLNGHDTFRYNGSNAAHDFGTNLGTPTSYTVTAVISLDDPNDTNLRSYLWGDNGHWAFTSIDTIGGQPAGLIQTELREETNPNLGLFRHSKADNQELTSLTYHIVTTRYNSGGNPTEILVDGVVVSQTQTGTANTVINLGATGLFTIGAPTLPNFSGIWLEGNIAELLIYDEYITGTEYTQKIDYLTDRYNL